MFKNLVLTFILICSCLYAEDGLIFYYPFNGNANDSSGNGLNGTVVGPVLTTDRFEMQNQAYSFDGQDDCIEVTHDERLNITEQISLIAWIYPIEKKSQRIICRSSSPQSPFDLSTSASGDLIFSLNINDQYTQSRKSGYDLDTWLFVVGVYDGNAMKLYVNNTLESIDSISGSIKTNTGTLLIGTRSRIPSSTFNGKIDELRCYNTAVSESFIDSLYDYEITNILNEDKIVPAKIVLKQNYPNPFNMTTSIEYTLAESGDVKLKVYDMQGRLIETLVEGYQVAGTKTINWQGKNREGIDVASGVYFYQLQTNHSKTGKKMILLK